MLNHSSWGQESAQWHCEMAFDCDEEDQVFDVVDEKQDVVLEIGDDMVKVFVDSWGCVCWIVDVVEEIGDGLVGDVEIGVEIVGEIGIGEVEVISHYDR